MGSLPRSRRPAPEPRALTVAPFDVAGAGVGDVPPTVAIETPDAVTALFIYTEPERTDALGYDRCVMALDAFRLGYEEAGGGTIVAALVAGVEAANDALYTPRQTRDGRRSGVGLTALAVRGPDAFVVQAGPGQALIAGSDDLIALPPLGTRMPPGGAGDENHSPPLGVGPTLEPNLFHIDAGGGLCAVLCHSSIAPLLRHGDNAPLRSFDAQVAAAYLVHLGERQRVSDVCGVAVSAGEAETVALPIPSPPLRTQRNARPAPARPVPRMDLFRDEDRDDTDDGWEVERNAQYDAAPPFPQHLSSPSSHGGSPARSRPPARDFAPPHSARHAPAWFDDSDDSTDADDPEWDDDNTTPPPRYRNTRSAADRSPARRALGEGQIIGMPTRLVMLAVAVGCTLAIFLGVNAVRAWNGHQENVRAIQQLDDIEGDRAQAAEIAKRDPPTAYALLEPLIGRLDTVAQSGRQTRRVQQEQLQLAKTLDMVGNVTRVVPKQVGQLDHLDGTVGNHRLLLLGDDGQLYLYDRDEQHNWALYSYDALSGRRGAALFAQGQIALRNPAGELRGLVYSGGPATSDRTRLFVRTINGSWQEISLGGLPDRRPAAVAMANDTLYLLDNVAGAIIRVSLRDNTPAKTWTSEGATADLKTGVGLVTDGQTVWVLLADGRVRGFGSNGIGTMLFTPSTLATLPPLNGAAAISVTNQYLYVAEASGGRILRIRKADGKLVQVLRSTGDPAPGLDTVQSITVDELHSVLWCVTADGVLSFPLPQIGV